MLKIIWNQIWNQRRMNGWIFLELLITSFFLWIVLDPICVLTSTKNIDPGYEAEGRLWYASPCTNRHMASLMLKQQPMTR